MNSFKENKQIELGNQTANLAKRLEQCICAPLEAAPEAYDMSTVKRELRTPEKTKPYWSISILGQSCFNFKGAKPKRVDVAPSIARLLIDAGMPVETRLNESGKEREEWPRISEKDLLDWLLYTNDHSVFVMVYEKLLQQNGFDCCSAYLQCSEAGHCIHADIMFAGQCTYRQKLKKGIIFFGNRRNI